MMEWLESHQIPCIYKNILGFECPTCGFQRALILLLKGEWVGSLKVYPALIPTLILLLLLLSWGLFRKPGWIFIKRFIQADLALIFISYFIRLIF